MIIIIILLISIIGLLICICAYYCYKYSTYLGPDDGDGVRYDCSNEEEALTETEEGEFVRDFMLYIWQL